MDISLELATLEDIADELANRTAEAGKKFIFATPGSGPYALLLHRDITTNDLLGWSRVLAKIAQEEIDSHKDEE